MHRHRRSQDWKVPYSALPSNTAAWSMRSRLASFCTGRTFPNLVILTLLLYISLFRRTDDAPPVLIPQPPAPAPGIVMTGSSFPKAATGPYVEPQATVHELDTLAARYAVNASDGVPLRLGLQSPMYNVRVLRTILTHQNNTWQDMPGEARGYFVQSLLWMQPIDAARPDYPSRALNVTCSFPQSQMESDVKLGDKQIFTHKARVHPYPIHPGDRYTGHNFQFFVDCQLPDDLQAIPHDVTDVALDISIAAGQLQTIDSQGVPSNTTLHFSTNDLKLNITRPKSEFSEFAVCLSPLLYDEQRIPLWKLVEWRLSMADLGIERVNWYYREGFFKAFVEGLNDLRSTKDTFTHAPNLADHKYREEPDGYDHYADQDVWYEECILNNVYSSDYILILDTDELFMVDWRKPEPLKQFQRFMRSMSPDKGTIEFDRIEMARPYERGAPPANELMQLSWDCLNDGTEIQQLVRTGTVVKVMYRAKSVIAVNQHKSRQMYPMPAAIAAAAKKGKHQRYQWHLQHSYKEDVWPKLVHYRWYGWKDFDVCESGTFMKDMPAYQEYLVGLRAEVASLVAKLAFINKYRLPRQSEVEQGMPRM